MKPNLLGSPDGDYYPEPSIDDEGGIIGTIIEKITDWF